MKLTFVTFYIELVSSSRTQDTCEMSLQVRRVNLYIINVGYYILAQTISQYIIDEPLEHTWHDFILVVPHSRTKRTFIHTLL